MPYCAVPGCTNGTNQKNKTSSGIRFHRLPSDPVLAAKWWQSIRRDAELKDVKDPRVCSAHFPPNSYSGTGRLNPGAHPLLAIPNNPPKDGGLAAARSARVEERSAEAAHAVQHLPSSSTQSASCSRCGELEEENKRLKMELELMRALPQAASGFHQLFTAQQAQALITGNRPRQWDEQTMLKAINVRVNSTRRQYNWLREELGYPLPGLSTLQKWLADLELRPGDWERQMALLALMMEPLSERDRTCVLMMDEMDVMSTMSYDIQGDQVMGPHQKVQVYLAGGLFRSWKIPVMYEFDGAVQPETLHQLIMAMELAGARVVATVSDMGGSNQGLWGRLGISHTGATSFTNPADSSRRVWVLADTPHIFKCLRNNVLSKGVRTTGGGIINKELMEKAVAVDGTNEFRLLYKVSLGTHVNISHMALQKVRPALQLLSATTATVIERFVPGKQEEARVIRLMDAACDVLNAIHPRDVKVLRRGYCGSAAQEEVLSAAAAECAEMRVVGAKKPYVFQKAFLVTVTSMRGLLADLRRLYGDVYLLTRRANQDRLESFFWMLRGRGGSSLNPTPTEVKARLRLLTLLLVMKNGVNPLRSEPSAAAAAAAAASSSDAASSSEADDDGGDDGLEEQLVTVQEEARTEKDGELAADVHQFATENAEEELLAFLNASPGDVGQPRPGPSSARDVETGITATESAMAYVAGYIARRAPDDARPALVSDPEEEGPLRNLWVRLRAQHRLTLPTDQMWHLFCDMETAFNIHHHGEPDQLSRDRGVIASFRAVLDNKFPGVPADLRATFARTRTFMRMGKVNRDRRVASEAKREARKRKEFAQ